MKRIKNKIVVVSYLIGLCFVLYGAWLKIIHSLNADTFLILGLFSSFIFIISAIYEISQSTLINRNEKRLWIVGLLFMSGIVSLIYLLRGRRRIATLQID